MRILRAISVRVIKDVLLASAVTFAATLQTATTVAAADPAGKLEGRIEAAATGERLPGATIAVLGTTRGVISNYNGEFVLWDLPAGTYSVRVSLIGYAPKVANDIVVNPRRPAQLVVKLEPTLIELSDSVVVRSGFFSRSSNADVSIQSQSSEEIRRLPGSFEDVVRATSNLPGVATVEAGRNDLIVRGGAPSENLYLVDGIEVSNINHFGTQGASGGPLSYIDLDFVDEITFFTGGFGARFGDRLSSVLDIRLRDGRSDRLGVKVTAAATRFGMNIEGPINDNGTFLFSARRSYLDLIFRAAGLEFVPEYWDFLFKTSYQLSPRDRVTALGIGALDNVRLFNNDADDRFENSRRLANNQDRFVGGATWRHLFSRGSVTASAAYTSVDYEYIQNDSLLNPFFESSSVEREAITQVAALFNASDRIKIATGGGAKFLRTDGTIRLDSFVTSFGRPLDVNNTFDVEGVKLGGYAQLAALLGRLSVTGGVRADRFDLLEQDVVWSPRLSSSLAVHPRITLTASVGRYHQAPSLIWLGANPYNRSLEYVRADHYVAGVDYLLREDTRLRIEGYAKRYAGVPASIAQPFLVMSNVGAGFGGSEENFSAFGLDSLQSRGRGRTYGVELLLEKKLSASPLYGTAAISLNRSEYAGMDGVYRDGAFDQRLIVNLTGGYVFNERWEVAGKLRIATGRPYTPYNTDGTQDPAAYNSARLRTNHSVDLRADRRWFFGGWNLVTYIDIQNIYNYKSHELPRYDGRTGEIDSRNALGILPTIGITAEF